jgi:hypothetical protein
VFHQALVVAPVAGIGVPVVAFLARVCEPVPAGPDEQTLAVALNARNRVAAVALFLVVYEPVAAGPFQNTMTAAPVTRKVVPVVAFFGGFYNAVAAGNAGAATEDPRAVLGGVAGFVSLHHPVPAHGIDVVSGVRAVGPLAAAGRKQGNGNECPDKRHEMMHGGCPGNGSSQSVNNPLKLKDILWERVFNSFPLNGLLLGDLGLYLRHAFLH